MTNGELSISYDELLALLGAKEAELFALRREVARLGAKLTAAKEQGNGYQPIDNQSGILVGEEK